MTGGAMSSRDTISWRVQELEDTFESAAAFRSRMAGFTNGRVPALAIAAFVREHGAVYSSEILDRFFLSETMLRRRRPALARLGVRFLENGEVWLVHTVLGAT
jgi:hypothetical protein